MAFNKQAEKVGILTPQEKLKVLSNYSDAVEVDPNIPPRRYYRSGMEMVRMAEVYVNEGNYENAYVLFMKFMTLFMEKIRKHPEYSTVPSNMKSVNQAKLREILPIAEKLKDKLLQQYTKEYNLYIEDLKFAKRERDKQIAAANRAREERRDSKPQIRTDETWEKLPSVVIPSVIDEISYPDPNDQSTSPAVADKTNTPTTSGSSLIPSVDRSNKPSLFSGSTTSTIRTILIPTDIMNKFLMLAKRNTMTNVETCGLLAGDLLRNQLVITTLIIPKQEGTSDSCSTLNEEEIFQYQDEHNLITMGWIHTHPTQTAFLSSVDLHTHCPYQILLPESIAIVCAPKYNETGFFCLTPDFGLPFISTCKKTGFHPHPTDPPLFMNADHIKLDDGLQLTVIDFRK